MERTRVRGQDDRGGRDRGSDRGHRGRDEGRRTFQYKARDASDVRRRAESGGSQYDVYIKDHIKTWKPHDKGNTIRILPPTWDDPKHYGLDIWVHYGVGPERQTYLCLHKMRGEPCPLCEEHAKAVREGDEEYARDLRATRRVLVYVIDRDNERDGVQAYAMPQTMDGDILKVSVDRKSGEVFAIDHPEDGFDVSFEKTGTKDRTKYEGVMIARRESSLGDDAWLDFAVENPLPDQLVYYSYDHIQRAFGGGSSQRDSRGSDRETGRERPSAGNDRDERSTRDSGRRSEPERKREPEHTWESVHALEGQDLDDLIDAERLDDINANDADSDAELADMICKALGIDEPKRGRDRDRDSGGGESARERLSRMRG